jgi:hypothetical protein
MTTLHLNSLNIDYLIKDEFFSLFNLCGNSLFVKFNKFSNFAI